MKEPYEMTEAEWETAWELTRPNAQGTGGDGSRLGGMGRSTTVKSLGKRLEAVQQERERLSFRIPDLWDEDGKQMTWANHFEVVERAIEQGKTIPPHVLEKHNHTKTVRHHSYMEWKEGQEMTNERQP